MFCVWCGAQVPDDSQFCPECGGNLHPGGNPETPPVQQPASGSPPAPEPPPMPEPPSTPEPPQVQKPVPRPPQPSPQPVPLTQPQAWYPPQPPTPPRKKGRGALIGILIAIICLLIAAVVFLVLKLFVWKNDDTSATSPTPSPAVSDTQAQGDAPADSTVSSTRPITPTPPPAPTPTPTPTPEPSSYYIIPDSDSRYLTRADLIGLTDEELRLARNEIYARHGRLFDDAGLQAYFDQQPWYHGTIAPGDFTQSMLNDYERQNTSLILEYENSR